MSVRVLFFASLADITGLRQAELEAASCRNVGSIYAHFENSFPQLRDHRASVLFALNAETAGPDTPVKDGDEVAFFPPVSGG